MAHAHVLDGLRKWLDRDEWHEPFGECMARHLVEPCEESGVAVEDLDDLLADDQLSVLWGCMFEDFISSEQEDGRNIIDDYLKRRGWKESVANKRYMMALRPSVMSLYEVSDVVRDQSFLARDLLRGGEPVRISEKSGTHSLKQWDRIAARLVRIGTRVEMAGGVLPLDRETADGIRAGFDALRQDMHAGILESAREGGVEMPLDRFALDTEALRHGAFLFTNIWLASALEHVLDPKLPKLVNGDGDDIVLTTVRYPLKPGADRAVIEAALDAVRDFHRAEGDLWNWAAPPSTKMPEAWDSASVVEAPLEDGSVSLGQIELAADEIVLEVNSLQRAQKGRAVLEPAVDPFVGAPAVASTSVEEMVASRLKSDAPPAAPSFLPPDEQHGLVQEISDRHYREILDQPVGMLGNVSPREAVATAEGRQSTVAWLKYMENMAARQAANSGRPAYDFGWVWEELGISDLRR